MPAEPGHPVKTRNTQGLLKVQPKEKFKDVLTNYADPNDKLTEKLEKAQSTLIGVARAEDRGKKN